MEQFLHPSIDDEFFIDFPSGQSSHVEEVD
jgi:hypothetical protein